MKKIFTIIFASISLMLHGQSPIDESAIPSPGISYQNGPGGSNNENWTYRYGAKLSVFGSTYRNFEIMNTQKTGSSTLAMRTYDGGAASWTNWREFVFKNQSGALDLANTGDGAELLRFSTERPWVFRQSNSGEVSQLDLHSTVSDKNFKITSPNNTRVVQFFVSDNSGSNGVILVPDGGNVGIGTTTPDSDAILTVKGNIKAREIKVTATAGGADFVFDDNYSLNTLEQIEKFTKKNKHLPEIPSAKEMDEEGINLAEMNIKLLQKVEELTLYLIEQNKEMKAQRKEIEELKIKIGD